MIGKTNSVTVSGGENTLKKVLDATKHADYLFSDYEGTSVDGLIQYSDTENITSVRYIFKQCRNLTTIPLFDTSKVNDMYGMFYNCTSLTTIPQLNTSSLMFVNSMFYNCWALTTIPQLNTSNVIYMNSMFYECRSLTTVPLFDTSNVTSMESMFQYCTNLTTVPALDVSKVTEMYGMFGGCTNLKSILMTNIGVNLDISSSTKFERTDLVTILNNLKTVTSSKKLTMGATNLAKLTDEDKAIATNKGWTLA